MLILDERRLVSELNKMKNSRPLYNSGISRDELRIILAETISRRWEELKKLKWYQVQYVKEPPLPVKDKLIIKIGELIDNCVKDGYVEYKDKPNDKDIIVSPKGLRLIDSWQNVWDILKHPLILKVVEFGIPSYTIIRIIIILKQ